MSLKLAAFGSDPNGGVRVVGVRQAKLGMDSAFWK